MQERKAKDLRQMGMLSLISVSKDIKLIFLKLLAAHKANIYVIITIDSCTATHYLQA